MKKFNNESFAIYGSLEFNQFHSKKACLISSCTKSVLSVVAYPGSPPSFYNTSLFKWNKGGPLNENSVPRRLNRSTDKRLRVRVTNLVYSSLLTHSIKYSQEYVVTALFSPSSLSHIFSVHVWHWKSLVVTLTAIHGSKRPTRTLQGRIQNYH